MAKSPFNNVEDSLYSGPSSSDLGGAEVELPEDGIDESDDFTIEEDEDGGATITFGDTDPEKMDISSLGFGDNLALVLDDSVLATVSQDLSSAIDEDDSGREEWKKTYEEGLTLLGLTYTERTEPFNGSTGVTHPLLNEAVTQFQAQSYKELLPASGPARARIVGKVTPEREQQADRVKNYMNYQITEVMEEYDPEFDQMLFYVGYGGSAFKKVYYDGDFGRAVSPYILPKDLIVPYGSRDLATAERVTHVLRVSENELRKQQVTGFYRDVELTGPTEPDRSDIEEKIDRISGIEPAGDPKDYVLWECHCYLDIEGFEDLDDEGEPTGIKLPYIVTIDSDSGDVLAIRRNYKKDDVRKKKKQYFVHYKFLPGLGFYGFGLIHLLGNLARSGTSILRQLIDAGTLANLPAGFKARGLRIQDQESPLQPGEWRDVDAPGGRHSNTVRAVSDTLVRTLSVESWSAGVMGILDADPVERRVVTAVLRSTDAHEDEIVSELSDLPPDAVVETISRLTAAGSLRTNPDGRLSIVARRRSLAGSAALLDRLGGMDD